MCELFVVNDSPEVGQHNNNAACFGRFFLIMYSLRQMPADGINSHLCKKEHSPKTDCALLKTYLLSFFSSLTAQRRQGAACDGMLTGTYSSRIGFHQVKP